MSANKAKIGSVQVDVPSLGFGCMSLSSNLYAAAPGELSEDTSKALLNKAYELGVRLFNTSDLYGPYTNEELLGRVLKDKPDVIIATKWGAMFKEGKIVFDFSPENCRACCEGSLRRLQREAIDIFTMRGPPKPEVPIEKTFEEVKKLVDEGKIKAVGMSECDVETIQRAARVTPVHVIEQEWSLFSRDIEQNGFIDLCREGGVTLLAYSPLGRGMLTDSFKVEELAQGDFRITGFPRMQGDNLQENLQLVENVKKMAADKGCSTGQLALAWLLAKGKQLGVTVIPIPGTKREKYLVDNMGALKVELTPEDLVRLEELVPADKVAGSRYGHMAGTYQGASNEGGPSPKMLQNSRQAASLLAGR